MTIPMVVLVAAPFAYGVALLATSRRGTRRVPSPVGYGTTPSARVWLGLAIVLPVVLGSIGAAFFPPAADGPGAWTGFFYFSPGLVGIGCVLVSYVVSMRPIKATIVAGLAPTFATWPDHQWWWDGRQWFGVSSVAPPSRAPLTGRQLLVDRRRVVPDARLAPAETAKVAVGFAGVIEPDPAEIA